MEKTALQRALDDADKSQSALARHLKLTPQAVQKMCAGGTIRAEHVNPIVEFFGRPELRFELRPDLYPNSTAEAAA